MKTADPRRHQAGATVLAPSGELDLVALPELRARLRPAIRPGATVVLDLQDVTFMDSSALSVVLTADRQLRATGGCLRLVNVADEVLRVLRICGLAERLVRRPEPSALADFPVAGTVHVSDLVR
jgi:anti-sigma B factor antagonist